MLSGSSSSSSSGNGSPRGVKSRQPGQPSPDDMSRQLAGAASTPPELWLPPRRQPAAAGAASQRPRLLKHVMYLALAAALLVNVGWIWHSRSSSVLLGQVSSSSTPAALQVESLRQDGTVAEEVLWGRQQGSVAKHAQRAQHDQPQAALNLGALEAIGRANSVQHTSGSTGSTAADSSSASEVSKSSNSSSSRGTRPREGEEPAAAAADGTGAAQAAAAAAGSPVWGVPSATELPSSSSAGWVAGAPLPSAELALGLRDSPSAEPSKPVAAATASVAAAAERVSKGRSGATRPVRERQEGRPLTAQVFPPETLSASPDNCSQALQAPRVALLFLTKGHLFHEPTWRLWFKSAVGLLPAGAVQGSACAQNADLEALRSACIAPQGAGILEQQHLFSIYVHAPPTFDLPGSPNITEYPEGSLWRGHLITHRLYPNWGGFSLVEATRNLLWEAFRDPLNQRFLLISESGVPLYDPLTLYAQLLSESKSRVVGCSRGGSDHPQRWSWHMMIPGLMRRSHWRKSSQWFVLLRDHARIILEDEPVFRKFEEWCWGGWDSDYNRWRDCYSDEHYIPTLLGGVHGRSAEMQCDGARGVSAADWTSGGPHPKSFKPRHATPDLITRARSYATRCAGALAQDRAQAQFVNASEALAPSHRDAVCATLERSPPHYDSPLSESCYLTVRKFPEETVSAVYSLFSNCTSGLRLVSDKVCATAEPLQL